MKNKKLVILLSKIAAQGNLFMLQKNLNQFSDLVNDEMLNQVITHAIYNSQLNIVEHLLNNFSHEFLNLIDNNDRFSTTPLMLAISKYHKRYERENTERTENEQKIIDLLIASSDCNWGRKKEMAINHNKKIQQKGEYSYSLDVLLSDAATTAITYLDFDSLLKIYGKDYNKNKYYKYPYYGEEAFGNGIHFILDFISRPIVKFQVDKNFSILKNVLVASITEENLFFNDHDGVSCIFSLIYSDKLSIQQKQDVLLEIFKKLPLLLEKPFTQEEINYYSKVAKENAHSRITDEELKNSEELAKNLYSLLEKQILEGKISLDSSLNVQERKKIKI